MSECQYRVVAGIGFATSSLSVLGSTAIIYIASSRVDQFYHRVMVGLSLSDVIVSVTVLLQAFLIPSDINPSIYSFATGTTASCSALGFFMRFPLAVAIYNCYLGLFFNHSLRNGWSENSSGWWEYSAHAGAFLLPISFGISGLATESFNFLPELRICDFGSSNSDCNGVNDDACVRGDKYAIQDWLYVAIMLVFTSISVAATVSVYIFYRAQYIANGRHHGFGTTQKDSQRVKQVACQTVLYLVAFLNGTVWTTATAISIDRGVSERPAFILSILAYTFFPLQGFWNSYIYIRPRWLMWRKTQGDASWSTMVMKVFSREEPAVRRRRGTMRSIKKSRSVLANEIHGSSLWNNMSHGGSSSLALSQRDQDGWNSNRSSTRSKNVQTIPSTIPEAIESQRADSGRMNSSLNDIVEWLSFDALPASDSAHLELASGSSNALDKEDAPAELTIEETLELQENSKKTAKQSRLAMIRDECFQGEKTTDLADRIQIADSQVNCSDDEGSTLFQV